MTCADAQPLLSAYFDRELDVPTSLEIERHLHECPGCAATVSDHAALRAAVGAGALAFAPPRGLERRVHAALRPQITPRAPFMRPWRWVALPAAATVAAALSWVVAIHTSAHDALLSDLVAGHVRALMVDHLVDVATSDQHTVKPWFNGKVEFAPPVADLTASGFPLVGGRVDYIAGRAVAVVVYKRHQHLINVFVWPSGNTEEQAPRAAAFESYHLVHWERSGLTFWAVSDINVAELESLAHLLQEAA